MSLKSTIYVKKPDIYHVLIKIDYEAGYQGALIADLQFFGPDCRDNPLCSPLRTAESLSGGFN